MAYYGGDGANIVLDPLPSTSDLCLYRFDLGVVGFSVSMACLSGKEEHNLGFQ